MKNIIKLLGALMIISMPQFLFAQTGNYKLNGKIGQLPTTAKAYLLYSNATGDQTDSVVIRNGTFTFSGTVTEPRSAYIIINKKGTGTNTNAINYISFYLEPVNMNVISPDSIENAKIIGGSVNADNDRFKASLAPVKAEMKALDKEYAAAPPETQKSKQFTDVIGKKEDSLRQVKRSLYLAFIKANPNSMVSLFALEGYAGSIPNVLEIEPIFNSLSNSIRSTKAANDYAAQMANIKRTSIGEMAPDFTLADTSGKPVSLHSFKGKYVLVDFWASWCVPCRGENPNVLIAFNAYKDKGFTVLGVSLDNAGAKDKWLKAIHDDHLTWTQVSDLKSWDNEAAKLYAVQAIPQNFLIDPNGKIVAKDLRGEDLINKLKELFGK